MKMVKIATTIFFNAMWSTKEDFVSFIEVESSTKILFQSLGIISSDQTLNVFLSFS